MMVSFQMRCGPDEVFTEQAARSLVGTTSTLHGHRLPVTGADLVDDQTILVTIDTPDDDSLAQVLQATLPVHLGFGTFPTR